MIKLLSVEREIYKSDGFKHIDFPFVADRNYDKLLIKYAYSPKKYEGDDAFRLAYEAFKEAYGEHEVDLNDVKQELPLNNHITLSLSKEDKLIGTAHRHANDMEIEIGATSTVGFFPAEITKGNYSITLSCHAVLSEKVMVKLEVYGV